MARTTFEHPAFKKEPYTEVMAFLWLVANAAYEPSAALERGELFATVRELASAWDWNCSKVFRYLQKLERETILERFSKQKRNGFRIRNYEKYQAFEFDHETDLKQDPKQKRNKSETRTILLTNKQETNNKSKARVRKFDPFSIPLPEQINTLEVQEAFTEFVDMRREIGKPLKSQRAVIALFNKLRQHPADTAARALRDSTAGQWQGVFPERAESRNGRHQKNSTEQALETIFGSPHET